MLNAVVVLFGAEIESCENDDVLAPSSIIYFPEPKSASSDVGPSLLRFYVHILRLSQL